MCEREAMQRNTEKRSTKRNPVSGEAQTLNQQFVVQIVFFSCKTPSMNKYYKVKEVGQKQKTEKEREKERKRERGAKVGDNNGQATHGARKHAWRRQAAWANLQSL